MPNLEIKDTFRYKSTDIAKYIVVLAYEKGISVNMTKVQKLLYITYGVYLRISEERLLDEHPQAWPYGPVFPTTRNRLSKVDDFSSISREDISDIKTIENDSNLNKVVDFVLNSFGEWNAGQLSEWSHSIGSPWDKTRNHEKFKWGNVISDQYIYEYFCSIINVG